MPDNIPKGTLETAVIYSSLGGMGGFIHYLDQIRKGEKFQFGLFTINIIISAWIASIIGPILPDTMAEATKYSITGMSGFLAYSILPFLEQKGIQLILKKLGIKI